MPVRGVVFDSVGGRPLRDAFVTILGASQSTTTDERGRFHFDSVPGGVRTIAVQHAVLDSIGFSGLSARANVGWANDEVRVAVPSFATFWRRVCGGARPPKDSGFVYGIIRDSRTKHPVAGATLHLSWVDFAIGDKHRLVNRRFSADVRTSTAGDYAVCGVPMDMAVYLRATTDSAETGTIELPVTGLRMQRRDLFVASRGGFGVVSGMLLDQSGSPFEDAIVTLDDSIEARSDYDGMFVFRHAPTGSRRLVARFVGISPLVTTIDVIPGDTTAVSLTMPKIATLATMRVTSPERASMLREEWEERKIRFHRHMIDSTVIMRSNELATALQSLPNLTVKRANNGTVNVFVPDGRGSSCVPELRVDGTMVNDFSQLASIPPTRVVGMEVYVHAMDIPPEFMRGGVRYPCGLVTVWTKWAFRLP